MNDFFGPMGAVAFATSKWSIADVHTWVKGHPPLVDVNKENTTTISGTSLYILSVLFDKNENYIVYKKTHDNSLDWENCFPLTTCSLEPARKFVPYLRIPTKDTASADGVEGFIARAGIASRQRKPVTVILDRTGKVTEKPGGL